MTDTELILERLRLAVEINTRLEYVQKVRDLCLQKIARIQQYYGEAKAMALLDAHAEKLESTAKVLAGAEPHFTQLSERF